MSGVVFRLGLFDHDGSLFVCVITAEVCVRPWCIEIAGKRIALVQGTRAPGKIIGRGCVLGRIFVFEADRAAGFDGKGRKAISIILNQDQGRGLQLFVVIDRGCGSGLIGRVKVGGNLDVFATGIVAKERVWHVIDFFIPVRSVKGNGRAFGADPSQGAAFADRIRFWIAVDFDHLDPWLVGDVSADLDFAKIRICKPLDGVEVAVPGEVGFIVWKNVTEPVCAVIVDSGKILTTDEVSGLE